MADDKEDTLRVTYEQLNEQVRSREASLTTILSILLPASLVLATLSVDPSVKDSTKVFPFLGVAALPGAAILVTVLALFYWVSGEQVDNVFWTHIHNLEDQLGISEGHKAIGNELKKKSIYRFRRRFFLVLLLLVIASYAWLFYNELAH
jgi:hypothetical protein